MLPRRLLTIPVGPNPATFVGAASASGNGGFWTTSNLTVSTGDIVLYTCSGETTSLDNPTEVNTGGTATLSSDLFPGFGFQTIIGSGGNDILVDCVVKEVTSGGTVNLTEGSGRDSAGFIMALRPSNGTLDFDTYATPDYGFSDTLSLSSIPPYYAIILFETIQDEGDTTPIIPSLRSGFTNASTEGWVVGQGGAAEGWGGRLSYDLTASASYSLSAPSNIGDASNPYWGAVGVVISNIF